MKIREKLLYLLLGFTFLILFLIKSGSQGCYKPKNIPFSTIYQSSFYWKLKEELKSSSRLVLFGNKGDGVLEFVDNYLNHESKNNKTVEILFREVRAGYDIDYKKHPVYYYTYHVLKYLYKHLVNESRDIIKLWILNNIESPCYSINKQLGKFVAEHAQDKILIICRKDKTSFKNTVSKNSYVKSLKFKIVEFVRPNISLLIKGLSKHSTNETLLKNMISYYDNDLSKINHLFVTENPINFFLSEFKQEFKTIDLLNQDP